MGIPVIVDAVRTAVGKRGGALRDIHPVTLGGHVLSALAERNSLDPALVDDVITTGSTANAAARALLRGGASAVDIVAFARVVQDG